MRLGRVAAGAVRPKLVCGRPGLEGRLTRCSGLELQPEPQLEPLMGWPRALAQRLLRGLPLTPPDLFQAQPGRETVRPASQTVGHPRFYFVP